MKILGPDRIIDEYKAMAKKAIENWFFDLIEHLLQAL